MPFIWDSGIGNRESVVAAAMILRRSVSFRGLFHLNILYMPKGPLLDWMDPALVTRVLDDLQAFAKKSKAIFLKLDPDVVLDQFVRQTLGKHHQRRLGHVVDRFIAEWLLGANGGVHQDHPATA